MSVIEPKPWHALPVEEVLKRVEAQPDGLEESEAQNRLERFGPNRLRPPKQRSAFMRFMLQFHNVLIYVLLAAGVATALLQHWIDAGVILGVVVINALIGFIQEGKAEKALDAIRNMLSPQAMVLRGGKRQVVPAESLVPGDVVLLQSGDKVPADLRLFDVKTLQIQEAALTGESVAVEKHARPVDESAALGDRSAMAYAGTLVTYGQGRGLVVATAENTEIGRISTMIADVEVLQTPLLRQIGQFGRWLTLAILVLSGITFAFGAIVHDVPLSDLFLSVVGLAVAAIPEGLPAILTITLAIGVQRMAGRNAIIRRLPAVETLGSVTVICSDKTGTLTRNEMTVQVIATAQSMIDVSGTGYAPEGGFTVEGREITCENMPVLRELAQGAALCADSELSQRDGVWSVDGDPTEGALLAVAAKAGMDLGFQAKNLPRTDSIPFESEHRFMATLHHDHDGKGYIFVKGAPEVILRMSSWQRLNDGGEAPLDMEYWQERIEDIASRGQRALALAVRHTTTEHVDLAFADVEGEMILLGLFGIADPPREEAIRAVARCHEAGIRVKMITGDHGLTARAIGQQLALRQTDRIMTGSDVEKLSDEELRQVVNDVDVFARMSPEHKLRLVKALQASGQVAAMTGDGVNDAPALKRADVGVAMGINGTEAAKEAAEMVLADDNFASISHAVEEGRTVYANIIKAITFILPTNGGQGFTIVLAILLGITLPITAVQILWVNMVTAVTLALALAFEPPEPDVMQHPPRKPGAPILSPFLIWRVFFVTVLLVGVTFGMLMMELQDGSSLEYARTAAVNALVFCEIAYLINTRFLEKSALNTNGLFGSRIALGAIAVVVVLQLLWTYAAPMQLLFGTTGIRGDTWALIGVAMVVVFLAVETEKAVLRKMHKRGAATSV
ncbi:cation-transporting P-type ATPase [Telmatospirillum sp. J64-1]|uniref:cation-transporting P-type ATPase n=1 Tax=Telmatospirillum sp. J64-1 TaxID=2502183 RepID=UPI00115DD37F|nr:cation-transporting P-type ATPase [Telmatospirillum sp. J64-1]